MISKIFSRRKVLPAALGGLGLGIVPAAAQSSGQRFAFRAHKNFQPQGDSLTQNYTPVTFGSTLFNDGGYFNTDVGCWRPPAGLIMMSANVWGQQNCAEPAVNQLYAPSNFCAKFHKINVVDGSKSFIDLMACPGWQPAGYANTAGATVNCIDYTDGSWVYQLIIFTISSTGGNDVVIDGNPAHTWWWGVAWC